MLSETKSLSGQLLLNEFRIINFFIKENTKQIVDHFEWPNCPLFHHVTKNWTWFAFYSKGGIDKKCFLGWGRLVNSIYHSVLRNLSNLSIIWCTKYWGLNVALIRGKPCYQPIWLFLWTNFTALGGNQLMSLVISKHMAAIW